MLHEIIVEAGRRGQALRCVPEGNSPIRGLLSVFGGAVGHRKNGLCTIEGIKAHKVKPSLKLKGGESIAIEVEELPDLEAVPEDIPLEILHEDDDLVVVNKAAGMVVHPAIGHPRGTLINALLGRYHLHGGEPSRPGLIHRLDADTTGIIAVARNQAALAFYQDRFRERSVKKTYLALIHGSPMSDFLEHAGHLGRHPKDFRKRAVLAEDHSGAKSAYTHFVVRGRYEGYSIIEAHPKTGRTHQIRVHAADLGHPILADAVYGRSDRFPVNGTPRIRRQALHAWKLALPQPDGSTLTLSAPIPQDILGLIPDLDLE